MPMLLLLLACSPSEPKDSGLLDTDLADDTGDPTGGETGESGDDSGETGESGDDSGETGESGGDSGETGETGDDTACTAVAFADTDGDGYGDPHATTAACDGIPAGYTGDASDCDDANGEIHPGAEDTCDDGIDADCDGADRSCTLYGRVDTSAAALRLTSGSTGQLGTALGVAPDTDGDGREQLLVGSPGARIDGGDGAILVYPGMPGSGDALGEAASVVVGDGITLGMAFGALPDGDGDGQWELVGCGGTGGGAWWWPSLPAGTSSVADAALTFTASGESYFGRWCGDAGDVDGDGLSDAWVTTSRSGAGLPSVYLFTALAAGARTSADAFVTLAGQSSSDSLGMLSPAGDVDGDGLDDVLVGRSDPYGSGTPTGAALLLGGLAGTVSVDTADAIYTPEPSTAGTGNVVAAGGDLDGDGLGDVVVGAKFASRPEAYSGALYVVSGARRGTIGLATADVILAGHVSEGIGGSLFVRDLDGDGTLELVTGSDTADDGRTTETGAVWVFRGPLAGTMTTDAASDRVGGAATQDRAGSAVTAGQLDGLGNLDLVVGGPLDEAAAGSVWIFPAG